MKRIFSIVPIVIAILSIVVISAMPHHHHGEVLCTVVERCEQDNAYNDEHTGQDSGESREINCIADAEYVLSNTNKDELVSYNEGYSLSFFLFFSAFTGCLVRVRVQLYREVMYGEYGVSCTSALLGDSRGLRAPPYYFF